MRDPRPPEEIEPVHIDPDMSSDQQDEEVDEREGDDQDTDAGTL